MVTGGSEENGLIVLVVVCVVPKLAIFTLKVTIFVYQEGLLSFLGSHVR